MDTCPTIILHNTATKRFHPMSYRHHPLPLTPGVPLAQTPRRYKSIGHHTLGFDTRAEAEAWVRANEPMRLLAWLRADWNGTDSPSDVQYFGFEGEEEPGEAKEATVTGGVTA